MAKAKSPCHCRNHMGSQKIQYRGRRQALNEAMKRAKRYRGYQFRLYPCPAGEGIWHLATRDRESNRG